jgi:hypothetical protein
VINEDVDLTLFASDFQDIKHYKQLEEAFLGNPVVYLFRKTGFLDDSLELRLYSYSKGWGNDIFFAYDFNETNMYVGYGHGKKYR